jgi:hypothetical protein
VDRAIVGDHTGQASSCSAGTCGVSFLYNSHYFPFSNLVPIKKSRVPFSALPLFPSGPLRRVWLGCGRPAASALA